MITATPARIQRSRQSKQTSPNGLPVVYGGRPGIGGNPFKIVGDMVFGYAGHCSKILSDWIIIKPEKNTFINWEKTPLDEIVLALYENWLTEKDTNGIILPPTLKEIKEKFRCKNISCWCDPFEKCHADILLKIANN